MRVLVTGGSGQLGRALAAAAAPDVALIAPPKADFDITDRRAMARIIAEVAPDVLINAAAYTAVDRAEREPEQAMLVNGTAPGWLAEAAQAAGAAFVHVSTDFVFDGARGSPYPPDALPSPLSVYGATKRAGEEAVLAAHPDALVVRTAWVYAAEGQNFVRTMLRLLAERDEVRVVADQVGSPTHAASLARALLALVRAGATGVQHWTDAGVASWYDFAIAIREEALARWLLAHAAPVVPIRTADYPTAAKRPSCSVLDCSAARACIGLPAHWREELRVALDMIVTGRAA
ncbi:dTDP-4-dehydrorhamnose reductase [Thermaurantiacus sp.]